MCDNAKQSMKMTGWLVLAGVIALSACADRDPPPSADPVAESPPAVQPPPLPIPTPEPEPEPVEAGQVRFLEQGFSADDRQAYYYLSQGSQLIPYHWFLALEQVGTETLFRDDEHMRSLGYIPQAPDPARNPDGLPIGITRDDAPDSALSFDIKQEFLGDAFEVGSYPTTNAWMGMTCAACHTSQIDYKGQSIRIDGGAALIDHQAFMTSLAAALQATPDDPDRMERFARRVLAPNWSQAEQDALRDRVIAYTEVLNRLVAQNATDLAYGHGRLDAFGAILNRVTETGLGIPSNHAESSAPVSFPFLWTAPELDWVQWNSATSNAIARNTGEVMGVYAHFQLTGTPATGQFSSTARLHNLDRIESYVAQLEAPPWPEDVFGAIDSDLAVMGEALYADNCVSCHVVRDAAGDFPRHEPQEGELKQFIITHSPSLEALGTDPQMINNVRSRFADPGTLMSAEQIAQLPDHVKQEDRVLALVVLGAAVRGVITRLLSEEFAGRGLEGEALKKAMMEAGVRLNGGRTTPAQLDPPPQIIVTYKARPLNGIWATAPYLHNGSVPSLAQLLLPEEQRIQRFRVGSREFDPADVGYVIDSGFEFDTALAGNRNTGHSGERYTQTQTEDGQWRDFSAEERLALLEYLKTLH